MIPQAFWLCQVLELRFAGDGVIFSELGFRGFQLILGFLPCSRINVSFRVQRCSEETGLLCFPVARRIQYA
jgi:hypothetical protein